MARVFLSYAREDLARATALARALERSGHQLWWDRHVGGGAKFAAEIARALKESEIVIVLWSRSSVESTWVQDEAAEGRDRGRLVPVSIDDSLPPLGFRQFQAIDLSHWSGRRSSAPFKALEQAIAAVLKGERAVLPPPRRKPWPRWRSATAALAALVLVAVAALLWLGSAERQPKTSAPTVALLPISAPTNDPAARELASATRDSLAHMLSESGIAPRMAAASPGTAIPADFLLSGDIRTGGGTIEAFIRLEEQRHRIVMFSKRWTVPVTDAASLPDRIGVQVASSLGGVVPMFVLDQRHPSPPEITAELLRALSLTIEGAEPLRAYEISRRIAPRAPDSAGAQLALALYTGFALGHIPRDQRAAALVAGRQAAERARKLAPEMSGAYAAWCLLHSSVRVIECETQLRAGMRVDPDADFARSNLSALLSSVGRREEALELARASLADDPYKLYKLARLLRSLESAGEVKEANDIFVRAKRWWPDHDDLEWNRALGILERGDLPALARLAANGTSAMPLDPPLAIRLAAAVRARSAVKVRDACPTTIAFPDDMLCVVALSQVGDFDRAFAIANAVYTDLRAPTPAGEDRLLVGSPGGPSVSPLTSPATTALRRDPRFLALADRVGLLRYWRSGRLPDFCRARRPEPVCAHFTQQRR